MNVYVWQVVEKCSDNYHSHGGVVVFADSEQRARDLANNESGCEIREDENPDVSYPVVGGVEQVFIIPDVGCC